MIQIERNVSVKVELVDGSHTWITVIPLTNPDARTVQMAAGEAVAMFIANIERDYEHVNLHLRGARSA